jgi:hypothetical protein
MNFCIGSRVSGRWLLVALIAAICFATGCSRDPNNGDQNNGDETKVGQNNVDRERVDPNDSDQDAVDQNNGDQTKVGQNTVDRKGVAPNDSGQKNVDEKHDDYARLAGTKAGEERAFGELQMKFCWCPAGKFTMGSPADEAGHRGNEGQVDVTLTQGFWLGKTEVTQAQWKAVMGTTPWKGRSLVKEGSDYPAVFGPREQPVAKQIAVIKATRSHPPKTLELMQKYIARYSL